MATLIRVKRKHEGVWHFALTSEIRPVCACGCVGPGLRRKRGDTLCRCHCHRFGLGRTLSLCEKLNRREQSLPEQLSFIEDEEPGTFYAVKRIPWSVVVGRDQGCQVCNRVGIKLTRDELKATQGILERAKGDEFR